MRYWLLIFLTFFYGICFGQQHKKSANRIVTNDKSAITPGEHLAPNVKTVLKKRYIIGCISASNPQGLFSAYLDSFSKNGKKVAGIKYTKNGTVDSRWVTIYDEKSGKMQETCTYDSIGKLIRKAHYSYENGKETEITIQALPTIESGRTQSRYDKDGNLTEWIRYNADNKPVWKNIYTYDHKFRKTGEYTITINDSSGIETVLSAINYKYDKENNKIEEKYSYKANHNNKTIKYKYNVKKKLVEESSYYSNGIIFMKKDYKYEGLATHIKISYYLSDGKIDTQRADRYLYKYDVSGNELECFSYNKQGEIDYPNSYINTFEYDKQGSVVKQTKTTTRSSAQVVLDNTDITVVYY